MTDEDRPGEEPGWAAPHLPPREPAGDAPAPAAPPPPPPPPAPPPSAAWTGPPAATTPPPSGWGVPRRRRGWIFALVGVLAAIVIVAAVGTALFVSNTLPPFDAANDFVNHLADGELQAAADQLCSSDRGNAASALSTVTRHFPGNDQISVNPLTVDRDGDRATVDYTVSPNDGGTGDTYELPLRKEGGDWRPCPSDALR